MRERIIIIVVVIATSLTTMAQENLNINRFFGEEYVSNPKVTFVEVTGKKLQGTGLTKYKSISVADDVALADKIKGAVVSDGRKARSKEVSYKEGQLYFGFYSMGGEGSGRSYIFYLNRRPVGKEKTTLIFIQGNLSEQQVKDLINK
jgi:hypothetical protein